MYVITIHIYIYIYIYASTKLHIWLDVWVPLAAVNILGKYLFLNRIAILILETKRVCDFN